MKKLKSFLILGHGQVFATDINGEQVPELQRGSIPCLIGNHIQSCGYDPESVVIETLQGRQRLKKSEHFGWVWTLA
jgi:predicted  nucleic acid-binding Zn ribbon protein